MKIDISKYYCKTTDPAFDEYVKLAREKYGEWCAINLIKFKKEEGDVYIDASSNLCRGGWSRTGNAFKEKSMILFTTQQHIKEQVMNDKIMEAVVALNGDYQNVNNSPVWDGLDGACSIFLDDQGYWLTLSDFGSLCNCNCNRSKTGDLTPICTVAEFEEAAAKWKADKPNPQEVNPDVIPFELESGKHAVKMTDGKFGIVLGEYVVFGCGFDVIAAVKSKIVEVRRLNLLREGGLPLLGFGVNNLLSKGDRLYLLWEKPIKIPQQLEVERLKKILADTQAELDKLTESGTGGLNE